MAQRAIWNSSDVCHICLYLSLLPGGGLPIITEREREREKGFKRLLSCVSVDTSLPDSPGMWAPLLPYSHLAHIP